MKSKTPEETLYVSGDCVEPGRYRDIESGAVVHVAVADELPEGQQIVRFQRYFRREDDHLEDNLQGRYPGPDLRGLIYARADRMAQRIVRAAENAGRAAHSRRTAMNIAPQSCSQV